MNGAASRSRSGSGSATAPLYDVADVVGGIARELGDAVAARVARTVEANGATLSEAIRGLATRDAKASEEIGRAIVAAVESAIGRVAVPVTVHQRADFEAAFSVNPSTFEPLSKAFDAAARSIVEAVAGQAEAGERLLARELPAPQVAVTVDTAPIAGAVGERADSSTAAAVAVAEALGEHAKATADAAAATAALAAAVAKPRRTVVRIERDRDGRATKYVLEESA